MVLMPTWLDGKAAVGRSPLACVASTSEQNVVTEIVAQHREAACLYFFQPHGMEVILRPRHGQKQVDEVIDEEARQDDIGCFSKKLAAAEEGSQCCQEYQRVVGEIAQVEQFAPHYRRQMACKFERQNSYVSGYQ